MCVATDVAARGIDLPDLGLVIHAELPHDAEVLQHRSGRTGRAGRKGVCVLLVPYPKVRRTEAMLRAANVRAAWMDAPTAEAIHAQDETRLLEEITDAGDDRAAAEALLAAKPAIDIAAALLRLQRTRLPAPEDLSDSGPAQRPATADTGPRAGFEDSVWFRINAGRNVDVDPRWLLPYLCRRGHLTKRDIGAIRIFDRETRFEVPRAVAGKFAAALKKTDSDPDVAIEPAGAAPEPTRATRRGPAPHHSRPPDAMT